MAKARSNATELPVEDATAAEVQSGAGVSVLDHLPEAERGTPAAPPAPLADDAEHPCGLPMDLLRNRPAIVAYVNDNSISQESRLNLDISQAESAMYGKYRAAQHDPVSIDFFVCAIRMHKANWPRKPEQSKDIHKLRIN